MERFFSELIRELKTPAVKITPLLWRAEEEFERQGYRAEMPFGVDNILILRLDATGDMILTSAFIREVRANFPSARITLICSPFVYPIVELCPYVNEILCFDMRTLNKNFPTMFETVADFCRDNLWSQYFTIAFSPQWGSDNLPALLMAWLSGARERIGYGTYPYASWLGASPKEVSAPDNFLLTQNVVTPRTIISEVDKCLYLLQACGLKLHQDNTELWFGAADYLTARRLLKDIPTSRRKVLLGIGAGGNSRKYPVDKYLVALRELVNRGLTFVIVGGKAELNDANFIEQNMPRGKVLNLVGKTTLRETEAVTAQVDYYIGNDTGVLHMAAAANVPVLALYREAQDKEDILPGVFSEFQRFPPWQTKAIILRPDHPLGDCANKPPCYGWCHHGEPHCITQITPQEIIVAFEALETMT